MPLRPDGHAETKIIAVANQKGGVGKTTTAINLAASLALAGKTVVLIDLDPQCNATTGLGVEPDDQETSMYEVILRQARLKAAIVETSVSGLDLVPSSPDLSSADVELSGRDSPALALRSALAGLGRLDPLPEFVFIDCPPALNMLTVNALAASDSVLIPLQCEYYALEGLSRLILTIRQIRENLNPELRVQGVLLSMHDRRIRLSQQVERDARENLGTLVYETVIPRNVRLSEAPSFGLPVSRYDAKSTGNVAYQRLAKEFLEGFRVTGTAGPAKQGRETGPSGG